MEWRDWAAGIAIALTIVNLFISWHWRRGDRTLAFVRRKQDALRQANTNILALRNLQFMLLAMAHAKDEWLAKGKASVATGSLLEQHLRAMHLESGNLLKRTQQIYENLERMRDGDIVEIENTCRLLDEQLAIAEQPLARLRELLENAESSIWDFSKETSGKEAEPR